MSDHPLMGVSSKNMEGQKIVLETPKNHQNSRKKRGFCENPKKLKKSQKKRQKVPVHTVKFSIYVTCSVVSLYTS